MKVCWTCVQFAKTLIMTFVPMWFRPSFFRCPEEKQQFNSNVELGDWIHQGWASRVALGPLAGVHQVKQTSLGRGFVVAVSL